MAVWRSDSRVRSVRASVERRDVLCKSAFAAAVQRALVAANFERAVGRVTRFAATHRSWSDGARVVAFDAATIVEGVKCSRSEEMVAYASMMLRDNVSRLRPSIPLSSRLATYLPTKHRYPNNSSGETIQLKRSELHPFCGERSVYFDFSLECSTIWTAILPSLHMPKNSATKKSSQPVAAPAAEPVAAPAAEPVAAQATEPVAAQAAEPVAAPAAESVAAPAAESVAAPAAEPVAAHLAKRDNASKKMAKKAKTSKKDAPVVSGVDSADADVPMEDPSIAAPGAKKRKNAEEGGRPKRRNTSGFVLFQRKFYEDKKEQLTNMDFRGKSKACGDAWRDLCDAEKLEFRSQADALRGPVAEKKASASRTTSFFLFVGEVRQQIKEANPSLKAQEVAKLAGEQWRNLSEDEKKVFADKATVYNAQVGKPMTMDMEVTA